MEREPAQRPGKSADVPMISRLVHLGEVAQEGCPKNPYSAPLSDEASDLFIYLGDEPRHPKMPPDRPSSSPPHIET